MASNLKILSDLIAACVNDIDSNCKARAMTFPSLDEPCTPEREAARNESSVLHSISVLVAAAYQLIATARPPATTVVTSGCSYYLATCLRIATETNVSEILKEAGPDGCHVQEIARKIGEFDPTKLSRVLRYLATHHIFREVSPDVYANNSLSSVIDTGKSLSEIQERPNDKHDGTTGIAALIGHTADEDMKGAAYLLETLTDPETAHSEDPVKAPMMRAFNSSLPVWSWLELPENRYRFQRFGMAMAGVNSMQPAEAILTGFDWKALPEGSVVVDVGGGVGTASLALAKAFSSLRLIVQDRQAVVEEGIKNASIQMAEALESQRLQFERQDFFEAQPTRDVAVFLLKQITHDWADSYATRLLQQLRTAASPTTRLLIIDSIVPYACPTPEFGRKIPGALPSPVPEPLLPNLGAYDPMPYVADLSMLVHFNAQERTLGHLDQLLKAAGWEIVRVYRSENGSQYLPQIEAIPTVIPERVVSQSNTPITS